MKNDYVKEKKIKTVLLNKENVWLRKKEFIMSFAKQPQEKLMDSHFWMF